MTVDITGLPVDVIWKITEFWWQDHVMWLFTAGYSRVQLHTGCACAVNLSRAINLLLTLGRRDCTRIRLAQREGLCNRKGRLQVSHGPCLPANFPVPRICTLCCCGFDPWRKDSEKNIKALRLLESTYTRRAGSATELLYCWLKE